VVIVTVEVVAVAVVAVLTVMNVAPAEREAKKKTWVPLALILATGVPNNSSPAVTENAVDLAVNAAVALEVIVVVSVIEMTALLVNLTMAHLVLTLVIGVPSSLSPAVIVIAVPLVVDSVIVATEMVDSVIVVTEIPLENLAVLTSKTSGKEKAVLMTPSLLALMTALVARLTISPLVNVVVGLQTAGEAVIVV
jgi:hypothetical protein